ncbi:unnamed protein product [Dracunculus medinensis]|uniref:ShKT domain-containing protein n=1 Tax=Dracunculus medinensis TaxID=318479 RepID=A0A0N4URS7_DRAME|nr:unnamed protein product [Dracunculus medinensis]
MLLTEIIIRKCDFAFFLIIVTNRFYSFFVNFFVVSHSFSQLLLIHLSFDSNVGAKECDKQHTCYQHYMKVLSIKNRRASAEFDHYKVSENCKKYPKLAEELCPHSCALCCKTKEYRCNNIADCNGITRAMCQTPTLFEALLKMCPQTCGLCHMAGAGNRCPNTLKECDILVRLAGCNDTIKAFCQESCHSLDCLKCKLLLRSQYSYLCVGLYGTVYANQCRFICSFCNGGMEKNIFFTGLNLEIKFILNPIFK